MTDHWKTYVEFLPKTIHTQSKAETYTIEGYNSILRHFHKDGDTALTIAKTKGNKHIINLLDLSITEHCKPDCFKTHSSVHT